LSPRRAAPPKRAPIDWLSILQFSLSALAVAALLSVASVSLLSALTQSAQDGFPMLLLAASMFVLAALLMPSIYYSLRRILGYASAPLQLERKRYGLILLLIPVALAAGLWSTDQNYELLIVIFNLLAVALSVAWILWIGIRDIRIGSQQRGWGALGSGMTATPFFALIIEGLALLVAGVALGLYIQGNPSLTQVIDQLQGMHSPEEMIEGVGHLAADPLIFATILFGLSVFVPIVEEVLKPIGVYLLLGRKLTNAQGFAIGALCGAGYALAETMLNSAGPDSLLIGNVARFGTTAMHIFTAALSGYGFARARNSGNWLLAPAFLLVSIVLHGAWNAAAVVMATSTLHMSGPVLAEFSPAAILSASLLGLLAFGSLFGLYVINRRLVASQPS
jgi:hypothetical protein